MQTGLVVNDGVITGCNKEYEGDVEISDTSINEIGNRAFSQAKLRSIDMSESQITTINKYAFAYSPNLLNVTFSSTLTTIGDHAFTGCGIYSIFLPSSIQSIEYAAFENCFNLDTITITNNQNYHTSNNYLLDSANNLLRAPISCTGEDLEKIKFVGIAESAFSLTRIKFYIASSSLIRLYTFALFNTYYLSYVDLSEAKINTIHPAMFKDAHALQELRLPKNTNELSYELFYRCSIKTVAIPATVTKIDAGIFYSAPNLENVVYYGKTQFSNKLNLSNTPKLKRIFVIKSYQYDSFGGLPVLKDAEYYFLYIKRSVPHKQFFPLHVSPLCYIFIL